jgi:hypothetical protein
MADLRSFLFPDRVAFGLLVFFLAVCSAAQGQVYYHDQEVHVHDLPKLTARTHSASDVLLTALDTIFHDKDVCCGKDSALQDSASAADPQSLKDVARKLEGRHLFADGRSMKVTVEYLAPDQLNASHVISMMLNQRAALMEWDSHLYVVHGVLFDETEDYSGLPTIFAVHKLLLWDLRYSDSRRDTFFDRLNDDIGKVQGLLFLQATPQ